MINIKGQLNILLNTCAPLKLINQCKLKVKSKPWIKKQKRALIKNPSLKKVNTCEK